MKKPFCVGTLLGLAALVAYGPTAKGQDRDGCPATARAVDRALCEQPALRRLQDALARNWKIWQQQCDGNAVRVSWKIPPHASWLADVRTEFDRLEGVAVQDYLGSTFTRRADELAHAISSCARGHDRPAPKVRIDMLDPPPMAGLDEASRLLFVRTTPALAGLRINDALYRDLLGMEAPESPRDEDVRKAFSRDPEPPSDTDASSSATETMKVSVLWRNSRLLVLQVDRSTCEARCWQYSEQHLFDLRTGDRVETDDLLSRDGSLALDRFGERSVLQEADRLRRRDETQWDFDEQEGFERCLQEWRGRRSKGGRQIVWLGDKRWKVHGPVCTSKDDAMPPSIDSKTFPLRSFVPYLSPYGKSLLLGEGDARKPTPSACGAPGMPPDPQGWAARVADISAGENHAFLREASGRVWGWGTNYDYALNKDHPGSGQWVDPFILGDDFLYAGAGQFFSAVVRRDGGLWTWGNGYQGRLGDGSVKGQRWQHVRIGENFMLADVDNYGGRALDQDGRLWAWDNQHPHIQVVAREVAQVRGSLPVLMLRRDGGLWAWNEWHWIRPGESSAAPEDLHWHGAGFERLPRSRKLELAWRADGTAWAWGRTLVTMMTPEALPGLEQSPWPRLVGRDWVDVKTSEASTLVAARKSDGSLWVSQSHGSGMRMDRLGCGFSDFAFAYDKAHGIHLLALRSDGALLDYHSGAGGSEAQHDLLQHKPQVLASGGVKLFQENDYWGNVGAEVFLLRRDGTLWQWYWHFGTQYPNEGVPPEKRLERIDFPKEWFQRDAPPQ